MLRCVFVFILTAFISLQGLSLDPGEYTYKGKLLASSNSSAVDISVSFVYKDGTFSNARFYNLMTGGEMYMKISGNETSITLTQQSTAIKYKMSLRFGSDNRLTGTATRNDITQKVDLRLTHLVKYVKRNPQPKIVEESPVEAVTESETSASDQTSYSAQVRQRGDAYSRPQNETRSTTASQTSSNNTQNASESRPKDDTVYSTANVQQQPEFPGGEAAMYKWMSAEIKYPAAAAVEGVSGRVTVEFVVTKTGAIENVRVVRGRHPALDKEALRVVKSMPNWEPGRNNGDPVSVTYILPVTFKLPQ